MKFLLLICCILFAGCTSTEYVGKTDVKKVYTYGQNGRAEWTAVKKEEAK